MSFVAGQVSVIDCAAAGASECVVVVVVVLVAHQLGCGVKVAGLQETVKSPHREEEAAEKFDSCSRMMSAFN